MKNTFSLLFILNIIALTSCTNGQPEETLVYSNDFEGSSLVQKEFGSINYAYNTSEKWFKFDGNTVLGRFGLGGIIIELKDLPTHDYFIVEYDFYVHDNWEGNGLRGNGEDVLIFNVDNTSIYFSSIINSKCIDQNCDTVQSFPDVIKSRTNPENANVTNPNLPGVCYWKGEIGGSKKFHIKELIPHSSVSSNITIGADIKDAGSDLCFKSWSVDNIKVTTVRVIDL
ncbi:hypothetical protein OB69_02955 [Roseivirga seohaensis subsp. aquiponti]|uniref:Lipoprotein n=1 Tax=Roseivirga seohaensis subsp. aquiponti TaxID=1566026 RepID=A0A0L8AP27_9BACT|nr:hypothetical protein [Roseivirga seohaensis]KOF03980.1 hypothetical protein OB69_02955 [Roseivirga seohaensis subsp. aquiponti]